MPFTGRKDSPFLSALNSFWRQFFSREDVFTSMFERLEVLMGQVYMDLMREALNVDVNETELFREELWHLLRVREDLMEYYPDEEFPYWFAPTASIEDTPFLASTVYAPNTVLKRGVDYIIEDGIFKFKKHPVNEEFPGVAIRKERSVPIVYYRGNRATFDGPSDGHDVVTVNGVLGEFNDGTIVGDVFTTANYSFESSDVGRNIYLPVSDTTLSIDKILSERSVKLGSAPGDGTDVPWEIREPDVFTSADVGSYLYVANDSIDGLSIRLEVQEVIDSRKVRLEEDIPFEVDTADRIEWRLESPTDVSQAFLWAPQAQFDVSDLYFSVGEVVGRYEDSSEAYRQLIQAILQYYILGPSLGNIESALNVMAGLPVIEESEEEVTGIEEGVGENDYLITDKNVYEVPPGTLETSISIGDTYQAFDSFTDVFAVEDIHSDPTVFYGNFLPEDIFEGTLNRRNISLKEHPDWTGLAGDDVYIGDPRRYIKADYTGHIPGKSGDLLFTLPAQSNNQAYVEGEAFRDADEGKTLEIVNHIGDVDTRAEISTVARRNTPDGWFSEITFTQFTSTTTSHGIDDFDGWDIESSSIDFTEHGRGTYILVPDTATEDFYVVNISHVYDQDNARLDQKFTEVYPPDVAANGSIISPESWRVDPRPPIMSDPSWNWVNLLMDQHLIYVSYNLDIDGVNQLNNEKDIKQVLQQGKPSWAEFIIDAETNTRTDDITATDELVEVIREAFFEDELVETSHDDIGDWFNVGDLFTYTSDDMTTTNIAVVTQYGSGAFNGYTFTYSGGSYSFSSSDVGARLLIQDVFFGTLDVYRVKNITSSSEVELERVNPNSTDLSGKSDSGFNWKFLPGYDTHTFPAIGGVGSDESGAPEEGFNDWAANITVTKP